MKKKIFAVLGLFIILIAAISWGLLSYSYSNGLRSGRLVKLSKKGVTYKTYEGTLDLGSGDALTWDFSVHDKQLAEKLSHLSGQMVKLEYREIIFKLFYDTTYDVTAFSLVENNLGSAFFCRLVNVLRHSQTVVEEIRTLVKENDPELLNHIRDCQ